MNILKILNIFRPFKSSKISTEDRIAVCASVETQGFLFATVGFMQAHTAIVEGVAFYTITRVRPMALHVAAATVLPLHNIDRIRSECHGT